MKLRGSARDGWLCAAHCGPPLAGGDGGATIATTFKGFCECDHTFLKHIVAIVSVVNDSEFTACITCARARKASDSGFLARLLTMEDNNATTLSASIANYASQSE